MMAPRHLAFRHAARGRLRAEEGALQIGRDDAVPEVLVDVERGPDLLMAGIVDEDVEPAKGIPPPRRPPRGCDRSLDVLDTDRIRVVVDEVADAFGGLDILVNNAGYEKVQPSLDVDEAVWDRIVDRPI